MKVSSQTLFALNNLLDCLPSISFIGFFPLIYLFHSMIIGRLFCGPALLKTKTLIYDYLPFVGELFELKFELFIRKQKKGFIFFIGNRPTASFGIWLDKKGKLFVRSALNSKMINSEQPLTLKKWIKIGIKQTKVGFSFFLESLKKVFSNYFYDFSYFSMIFRTTLNCMLMDN